MDASAESRTMKARRDGELSLAPSRPLSTHLWPTAAKYACRATRGQFLAMPAVRFVAPSFLSPSPFGVPTFVVQRANGLFQRTKQKAPSRPMTCAGVARSNKSKFVARSARRTSRSVATSFRQALTQMRRLRLAAGRLRCALLSSPLFPSTPHDWNWWPSSR